MPGMGRGAKRVSKHFIGPWIQHRGLMQREVADRLGVSEAYVSDIARNKKTPGVAIFLRLAKILGTSVESLFAPPPK